MKIAGLLSYNGSKYHGFEKQPHVRTIQGTLERVLSSFCGEKIAIKSSGRTDSGVHALGAVFAFSCARCFDLEKGRAAINRLLPPDISVLSWNEVPESFDPRHSSSGKVYEYRFSYGEKHPLEVGLLTQVKTRIFDVEAFKKALSYFEGEHDFRNFTSKPEDKDDFVRCIDSIEIQIDEEKKRGLVRFHGNHFMTYQIRFMVGAAFRAAFHKLSPEEVPLLLSRRPREIVHFKADPDGLYLVQVEYPDGF